MTSPDDAVRPGATYWDTYWRSDEASTLFAPALREALGAFWTAFFEMRFAPGAPLKMIDLACGDGDVLRHALNVAGPRSGEFVGLDYSAAAVKKLSSIDQRLVGIAASAESAPFDDGAFAVVTSQFGIEYAGAGAFTEAARLVAPGGALALAMHLDAGALYNECRSSLAATEEVLAARLLPLTGSVFRIGYDVLRGTQGPATLRQAEALLRPATEQAKDTLRRFGERVAGGKIVGLLQGLGQIYTRLQAYEPAEALRWVENADTELRAYAGRLRAMLDAAVDDATLADIVAELEASGLALERNDTLSAGPGNEPAARILVGVRDAR